MQQFWIKTVFLLRIEPVYTWRLLDGILVFTWYLLFLECSSPNILIGDDPVSHVTLCIALSRCETLSFKQTLSSSIAFNSGEMTL